MILPEGVCPSILYEEVTTPQAVQAGSSQQRAGTGMNTVT